MSRLEAWFHHAANILVCGTGVIYAWMLYFGEPADEFSLWNHPWQGSLRDLHLVLAPALILSFGMLWVSHARPNISKRTTTHRRRSGLTLALSFLPMMASAYFLQIAVEDLWRDVWKWAHLATSLLWVAAYVAHQAARLAKTKT